MSARNARRGLPGDMFPGMPDVLAKKPPKAEDGEHEIRTLDEAITRSHQILDEALATYPIVGTYWLSSGGNDSAIVGHLLRGRYDAVLHVNTGTGIPETTQYVRDVAVAWGDTLHELHPRNSYRDLVMGRVLATRGPNAGKRAVWQGFPGPVGHRVMYRHLKDEPLMAFRRSIVGDEGRTRKVIYLGGMRWAETERRFRNAEAIDQDGAIIWVSPIVHWTDAHMREYRARHRCQQQHDHAEHRLCFDGALPLNEVTEHIHMSGECLCGAYAKPGELDEIAFFYPDTAATLRDLEYQAERAGIPACRWGQKPPGGATPQVRPGACAPPAPPSQDRTNSPTTGATAASSPTSSTPHSPRRPRDVRPCRPVPRLPRLHGRCGRRRLRHHRPLCTHREADVTPDLYTAWLTAGNNLQPVVDWTVGHWTGLVALAVAAAVLWVVWWSIHDDTRRAERNDRNDRIAAQRADRIEDRPEPAEPGSNEDDLLICLQILAATNNARKEDR